MHLKFFATCLALATMALTSHVCDARKRDPPQDGVNQPDGSTAIQEKHEHLKGRKKVTTPCQLTNSTGDVIDVRNCSDACSGNSLQLLDANNAVQFTVTFCSGDVLNKTRLLVSILTMHSHLLGYAHAQTHTRTNKGQSSQAVS